MKIWLKLIIAGIIIFMVGAFIISVHDMTTEIGMIGFMVAVAGAAMFMIGILVGLKRGFRRMMNE